MRDSNTIYDEYHDRDIYVLSLYPALASGGHFPLSSFPLGVREDDGFRI